MSKLKALQEFLNDTPEFIKDYKISKIYLWRGIYFQILNYKDISKIKSRPDHFIKEGTYAIRELSKDLLRRYKLVLDK